MRFFITTALFLGLSVSAQANTSNDYLIQFKPERAKTTAVISQLRTAGAQVKALKAVGSWARVQLPSDIAVFDLMALESHPDVAYVQPNYKLGLSNTFKWSNPSYRAAILKELQPLSGLEDLFKTPPADNQPIPAPVTSSASGADPLFDKQWGMADGGVTQAWQTSRGNQDVIVAVIDTGVDYTHEDLIQNIWRNPGETGIDSQGRDKSTNGIDDDGNGYIDDVIGWDFASEDNMPYDHKASLMDMLLKGGNPGHGTHCAGNVAARGDNAKGIAGVAPNVKIMPLRFITTEGQGTTADAIEAINYAIKMGAKITSNSWGSEGEDPADAAGNKALRDAIAYSQKMGVLFVAAAGNGHQGVGYDNDTDSAPGYPASYSDDIIISVAALDVNGALGSFSNWGRNSVDIGAPGVKVFSTVVDNGYEDTVINLEMLGIVATWDGTSMATPHVAGAAALYWSAYPNKTWQEVKAAILETAKPTPSMNGKSTSGGRLDVAALMSRK